MRSPRQLAMFAHTLRGSATLSAYFDKLVSGSGLAAQPAIDQCFNFLRGAQYTFPEVLRATQDVFNVLGRAEVDYSFFPRSLQGWFLPGDLRTLEEFGIPVPIAQKYFDILPGDDPDRALDDLRLMPQSQRDRLARAEVAILSAAFTD